MCRGDPFGGRRPRVLVGRRRRGGPAALDAGANISGRLAAEAMDAVDRLNGDHKRALLVDMTGTATLTRDARGAFGRDCQVSQMAIVGTSAVDKVIANFGLRVGVIDIPARYFTSLPVALTWLREHETT